MLKSLLRTARVSSTLRNALQGAEVREAGGVRQFTCVGHDVKASSMMNGYAPRNASNHENCIEGATLPSSPMMLLGFHSLLPATALAVAELSRNAGPIQLPSSIELVYGENLKNGTPGQLPPAGSIIDWQCHTKRTFQPSLLVRKRRHGFLARISTRGGRRVIERRRQKGRQKLTA